MISAHPLRSMLAALAVHRSGVVGPGADALAKHLTDLAPFGVWEWKSGETYNGWIVPQAWSVEKATFRSAGTLRSLDGDRPQIAYDGKAHALGVPSYASSFTGDVRGKELKQHLFFHADIPDALVYHCDWWYKPHQRTWGFVVPKTLYDQVQDNAVYHVDLQCRDQPGTMKTLEWVLPGETTESIILNAHTCHPGLANDDLAGCVVGIEVMRRLALIAKRRFTYRLILAPEHYGTIFYLRDCAARGIFSARAALFLESLGSDGRLAMQESFTGTAAIDLALAAALPANANCDRFREIVGNDETCWEAAGVEIPCPSLSRVPFKEYHSSLDTVDIIHEDKLQEAVTVVLNALHALDTDVTMQRTCPPGLVCLSNPDIDLYQPYFDPSIPDRRTISDEARNWNRLMNHLPRYFDGATSCRDVARRFGLPYQAVRDYVQRWADKRLISLHPAP